MRNVYGQGNFPQGCKKRGKESKDEGKSVAQPDSNLTHLLAQFFSSKSGVCFFWKGWVRFIPVCLGDFFRRFLAVLFEFW